VRNYNRDKRIAMRSHGQKQTPAVEYTKSASSKKKGNPKSSQPAKSSLRFINPTQSGIAKMKTAEVQKGKAKGGPGSNKGIPLEMQTYCEYCHIFRKDISQHFESQIHADNVALGVKYFYCATCASHLPEAEQQSHICQLTSTPTTQSDQLVRNIKKMYKCESCNLSMHNTPEVVTAHKQSSAHQTQLMMIRDGDSRPDGPSLASATAHMNEDRVWISIVRKNGSVKRKKVPKPKPSAAVSAILVAADSTM
jgi:hypothetical protein